MSARVRFKLGLVLLLAAAAAGCGESEAEFVYHERTLGLLPDARKAVQATLDESFGTPQNLIAWQRLPVNYGGYAGQVQAAGEDGNVLQVSFEGDVEDAIAGAPLLWTSGDYAGQAAPVQSYDPETNRLTLNADIPEPPQPGDQFIVNFGQTLVRGQQAYMEHCVHCHGTSGDGEGPTAEYLNPYPRDYRHGKFKFTSTSRDSRPSREDLRRTVQQGIPGTYMPSFLLLDEEELDAVVEYVRWLSIRGEYEQKMIAEFETDFSEKSVENQLQTARLLYNSQLQAWEKNKQGERPEEPSAAAIRRELQADLDSALESFPETADELATEVAQAWANADSPESVILPREPRTITHESDPHAWEQSLASGRKIYMENCSNCHGPTGRGDGAQVFAFQKIPGTDEEYPEPGLYDDWGNPIEPRNLTRGIYRGGRRPIDLYRRVHQGIPGTPMPPFNSKLSDPQIWDLVNYVMNLPYEKSGPRPTPEPDHPLPVEAEKVRTVSQLGR